MVTLIPNGTWGLSKIKKKVWSLTIDRGWTIYVYKHRWGGHLMMVNPCLEHLWMETVVEYHNSQPIWGRLKSGKDETMKLVSCRTQFENLILKKGDKRSWNIIVNNNIN